MTPDMTIFKRVTIVGVGLIGGSLALSARENGSFAHITGVGRTRENLEKAKELGVVDAYTLNLAAGVKQSDLIVIATPVSAVVPLLVKMLPHLKENAVVTDVGSVKGSMMKKVESLSLGNICFVGGHPIAGTENSGVEAAFLGLFKGRKCVLTPSKLTNAAALEKIKSLWISVGSDVVIMDSERHDKIMAAVSHLPHVIAFTLVNFLSSIDSSHERIFNFSAGGLKDFTRIAASDPIMWRDIALMNKTNLVEMLDGYVKTLNAFKDLINGEDATGLQKEMQQSRNIRRNVIT
jgi:prephenate dehydrogenase